MKGSSTVADGIVAHRPDGHPLGIGQCDNNEYGGRFGLRKKGLLHGIS